MQLSSRLADAIRELGFDAHVDVFQLRLEPRPLRPVAVDFGFDLLQAVHDCVAIGVGDQLHLRQHRRVRDAAGDVVLVETPVVADRFNETLRDRIGGFGDARLPGLLGAHCMDSKTKQMEPRSHEDTKSVLNQGPLRDFVSSWFNSAFDSSATIARSSQEPLITLTSFLVD